MAVPVTNGVERTSLSQMKIGDYIKAIYTVTDTTEIGSLSISSGGGEKLKEL